MIKWSQQKPCTHTHTMPKLFPKKIPRNTNKRRLALSLFTKYCSESDYNIAYRALTRELPKGYCFESCD